MTCTYGEFGEQDRMRGEIERTLGCAEINYLDRLVAGQIDYLNRLPRKVVLRMLFHMDLVSISKLGQVNKLFRELCSCDALWSKIYMQHTNKPITEELLMLVDQKGWREVFFMSKLQLQKHLRRKGEEKEGQSRFLYGNKFLLKTKNVKKS